MAWRRFLGSKRDLLLRSFESAFGTAEWRPLLDFVSPAFFDVVPLRELLAQGRELVGNAADRRGRADVEAAVADAIAARGLALRIGRGAAADVDGDPEDAERTSRRAARVLELYFAQLYGAEACLVDLRAGAFAEAGDATRWRPGPWFVRWDPDFLDALRSLYRGFYGGDEADFDAALRALDLEGSRDLFRAHFGAEPDAVRFDRGRFVATFHDVFVRCRDQGVRLHRNFLPLGIYLACLHDHLATLGGGPFAVRSAFERAALGPHVEGPG